MAARTVAFGREAIQALRAAIDGAKAVDPFAEVTVAVGSVPCAVQLRRELVRDRAPEGAGLFGVRVATLSSLVRQLLPSGAQPCPEAVRWSLARRLLREDPGPFRDCVHHPELPLALLRAFEALDASEEPSGPLVGLWRRYRTELDALGLSDAKALAEALPPAIPPGFGRVLVFLPARPSGLERALLRRLHEAGAELLLGATGDAAADTWLSEWTAGPLPAASVASADEVVACTDTEQECREAVARVWRWVEQGIPLERQAIVFRRRDPYARIAFQVLREAGLLAYGRSYLRFSDSAVGTFLSVALDFAEQGFDANRLFDWLGSRGRRTEGDRPTNTAAWRRLVREVGVEANLEALLAGLDRLASLDARDFAEVLRRWSRTARDLFGSSVPEPWERRVNRLLEWVDDELPDEALPESERRQKERWRAKAVELGSAAAVHEQVDGPEFAWCVRQTLRGAGRAPGRLGAGVFVGTFEEVRGMDLDAVVLLGGVEGVCPTIVRGDPVLGLVPGALPPVEEQVARERELYLGALGSASRRVVLFPRVNRVDGSAWLPSRWIGDDLRSRGLDTEAYGRSPSFEARVRAGRFATTHEVDAASRSPHGRAAAWHRRCSERQSNRPGPHLGYVRELPELLQRPLAVTDVVDFLECPQRFFLRRVLRVAETPRTADLRPVDPARLGTAIHKAFADFFRSLQGSWPASWTDEHKARLRSFVEFRLQELESAGWIRRKSLWAFERERLPALAAELLDAEQAARPGPTPSKVLVELPFGDDGEGLEIEAGPFEMRLQGRIDWMEVFEDKVFVVDLKTGGSAQDELQVRLYLRAIEELQPTKTPKGAYLLLRADEEKRAAVVEWNDEARRETSECLEWMAGLVHSGWFPMTPMSGDDRESRCRGCPFHRLCPSDRVALQEAAMERVTTPKRGASDDA